MSVDYKTQREQDRELFIEEVKSEVAKIVEKYYKGEESIGYVMDKLIEVGLYERYVASTEAQIVGNNILSDDIIDYIMDRVDLEAITE